MSNYKQALTSRPNIFDKQLASVKNAMFVPTQSSTAPHMIISRDYLNVKLWDLRMATGNSTQEFLINEPRAGKPIYSAQVTDYVERNLVRLYENENLNDSFFANVTPDGKHIATGAYNKSGHIIDINANTNTSITCNFD